MELFDNLASFGLTTKMLQLIIVGSVILFFVGKFWKYLAAGGVALFCVVVLAMPSKQTDEVKVVLPVEVQEQSKVEVEQPPVAEVKPKTDMEMFIEDCGLQTKYTKAQCTALWNEHKDEIEAVKYRNKGKKNYMMKVNYVRT